MCSYSLLSPVSNPIGTASKLSPCLLCTLARGVSNPIGTASKYHGRYRTTHHRDVSNPIGTASKFRLEICTAVERCFKSHRDCFKMTIVNAKRKEEIRFKSHRDCFKIISFIMMRCSLVVSNPIGTASKCASFLLCSYINEFQIP